MPEFKFKCKICGREFVRLAQLSGHIAHLKNHPTTTEYYKKYPISEKKLKSYHNEYKKKKVTSEDQKYDVSETGKISYKRKDKILKQVADMGMSNVHIILGINSEECNEDYIKLLPVIFTRTNIHICIMGKNASKFKNILPDGLTTSLIIDSTTYNYSLAINVLLKQIADKFLSATVAIGDGWTMFSCLQLIQYEFKNLDWENNFIRVNTVFDSLETPINFNMNPVRLMSSTLNRLKATTDEGAYIPIVISRIKFLVDLESGLEEDLFSEHSRIHLINQLKTAGLTENISQKNKGLCVRKRRRNNVTENNDLGILKSIKPRLKHYIFIPSNFDIDWGRSDRICKMVVKDNSSEWTYDKRRLSLKKIYEINKDDIEVENCKEDVEDKSLDSEIVLDDSSKLLNKKHNILLLVDSKLQDLISATPLIRGLFEKFGEIDILTEDKLLPAVHIVKNYMVKKIYDIKDLKNKFFSMKTYGSNIISTMGCSLNLKKDVSIIKPANAYNNIVETNYSMVDPYILSMPKPFCYFKPIKGISNSITVAMSTNTDFRIDIKIWDCLDIISSRIGNNKNITVSLLELTGEKSLITNYSKYKLRKNFKVFRDLNPFKAASIISSGNLFLTTSDTDFSWLGYGLNTNMLLLDLDVNEYIPDNDCITRFCLNRDDAVDMDTVVNLIWRNL